MEHFSYKGGYDMTHTRYLKEELALVTYKQLQIISNIKLLKQLCQQETKE